MNQMIGEVSNMNVGLSALRIAVDERRKKRMNRKHRMMLKANDMGLSALSGKTTRLRDIHRWVVLRQRW